MIFEVQRVKIVPDKWLGMSICSLSCIVTGQVQLDCQVKSVQESPFEGWFIMMSTLEA